MSRSRRHSPVSGVTKARSNKSWKQQSNRRYRQAERQALHHDQEMPKIREVSNAYDSPKDGHLAWWGQDPETWWTPQPVWKVMMK